MPGRRRSRKNEETEKNKLKQALRSYLAKDVRRGAGTKGGDGESAHTDKTRHAISGAQSIAITNALIINSVIIY